MTCNLIIELCIEPVAYRDSYFGDGKYPILYSDFFCGGWETNLTHCDKRIFPHSKCSRDSVAGVLCGYGTNIILILYYIQCC